MASVCPKVTPCPNLESLMLNSGNEVAILPGWKPVFHLRLTSALEFVSMPKFR